MNDTVMETERLRLRRLTLVDVDRLLEIVGDPKTRLFYPAPWDRDMVEAWVERNLRLFEERGLGFHCLVRKDDDLVVGQCGLVTQDVEGTEEVEMGWHVDRRRWRRGYASEAAARLKEHALGELGLERLISLIRPVNEPSAGVARKIGMTIEKTIEWKGYTTHVFSVTRGGRQGG